MALLTATRKKKIDGTVPVEDHPDVARSRTIVENLRSHAKRLREELETMPSEAEVEAELIATGSMPTVRARVLVEVDLRRVSNAETEAAANLERDRTNAARDLREALDGERAEVLARQAEALRSLVKAMRARGAFLDRCNALGAISCDIETPPWTYSGLSLGPLRLSETAAALEAHVAEFERTGFRQDG